MINGSGISTFNVANKDISADDVKNEENVVDLSITVKYSFRIQNLGYMVKYVNIPFDCGNSAFLS